MSLSTPAHINTVVNNNAATVLTLSSFTPTANAALLIAVFCGGLTNPTITVADTFSDTITWTTQVNTTTANLTGYLFTGTGFSGSPGSGAVQATMSVTVPRSIMIVDEVTGHDTTTPVSETGQDNTISSGVLNASLGGIAAGNLTWGAVVNFNGTSVTPGAGETELVEAATSAASQNIRVQSQHGSDTSVSWSGLSATQGIGLSMELQAAPEDVFIPQIKII